MTLDKILKTYKKHLVDGYILRININSSRHTIHYSLEVETENLPRLDELTGRMLMKCIRFSDKTIIYANNNNDQYKKNKEQI